VEPGGLRVGDLSLESTHNLASVANFHSRNLLFWARNGKDVRVETVWKPQGIIAAQRRLPRRRFVFPCRSLCGYDLTWPHPTCWAFCRIRRTYYGKLPNPLAIEVVQFRLGLFAYTLFPRSGRRFATIRNILIVGCFRVARFALGPLPAFQARLRGRNLIMWACLTTSEALAG